MKRVLLGALAAVVLPIVAIMGYAAAVFGVDEPLRGGASLGMVKTVAAGYSGAFVLPAGPGKVALVDCGVDPGAKAILAELAARRLGPEAVAAIFLTHGHRDHVSGCAKFPGAQVMAMAGEADLLEGKVAPRGPLPRFFGPGKPVRTIRFLEDEEQVKVGPLAVTAYAIPGHTAGSAAYLAEGVLFLGDSADHLRTGALAQGKWIFTDDMEQNARSLRDLAARVAPASASVRWLAFAHSGAMEGLAPLERFADGGR
ncbi:MAG: MBL fold metallo-hydrolase [Candidatus Sericytochromatia bacterium]|nr:MBL fold metallo-hydrolase [Candidatus Tanganyikabacteria bacterium]